MNPSTRTRTIRRLPTLVLCLLGLAGCASPERANTRVVPPVDESQPLPSMPLGRIAVVPFLGDSMLRIKFPLPRGKAVNANSAGALRSFIPDPLPPESIRSVPSGEAGLALTLGYGAATALGIALGSVGALVEGTAAALSGIPAAEYDPAFKAITNAQAQISLTEGLSRRVIAMAQERRSLAFVATQSWEAPDTILELYEGERRLIGGGGANPRMQLRLGFRCTVQRASDRQPIHVFRVTYVSVSRTFVQWSAQDARLFREEVESGLADMAGMIVARLIAMDAPAPAGDRLANSPP